MANVNAAIDYMMGWEDSTLSGRVTHTKDGKRTRFGVDEHSHPELTACGYYDTMTVGAAFQVARKLYTEEYADPLHIKDIVNQEVADKLLSLGVNIGVRTAAKMLQQALTISGDGHIGPLTLHALDLAIPQRLLADLRLYAENHYNKVIAAHPEDEIYRVGWMRRADA